MNSTSYPFIDLAVLEGVREPLAAGNAVLLLSENLDQVLLANSAGAQIAGFEGPFDIVGENPLLGISAKRQIAALELTSDLGRIFTIGLRLSGGIESRVVMVSLCATRLPGGERAIVLSWPAPTQSPNTIIHAMADDVTHFAVLDKSGTILAASDLFESLAISDFDLAQLTAQTLNESDRLVKRRLKSGANSIPVGIGRLRDDPALFIMLAIAEGVRALEPVIDSVIEGPHESVSNIEAPTDQPNIDTDLPITEPINSTPTASSMSESPPSDSVHNPHLGAKAQPIRFTWKIDAQGSFSYLSPEFASALGKQATDIIGRSFKDVASVFAFDHGGEITDLLARRDTWSGRTVLWPIEGTDRRAPVDLAALPVYDRDREFIGFRGFGIIRLDETVVDPEALGLVLVTPPNPASVPHDNDPYHGEVPAITISSPSPVVRVDDDKIVHLGDHRQIKERQSEASEKSQLTALERNAFREIADRLRRDGVVPDVQSAIEPDVNLQQAPDLCNNLPNNLSMDVRPNLEVTVSESVDVDEQGTRELSKEDVPSADQTPTLDDDPDYHLPFDPDPDTVKASQFDAAPILSKLPVPVLIHNGASLLYGNPAFFELTLYNSLDELEQEGGIEHLLHVSPSAGETVPSSKIVMADNKEISVRAHLHSVRWKGDHALLLSLRPLEQTQAHSSATTQTIDRLTREVAQLSSVLETATDGVIFVNHDGSIRAINQSAEALFGFDPAAVSGKPFTHLLATESQKTAQDYISNLAGTGVASLINDGREVIGREAHGRFIPLFMTIGKLEADNGYCVVLRDITQWKRAEEELGAAKRAAEHASTQKSEFLARVSHEIRTPLNAIIGFSDMMSEERFGPVGNARYLDYLNDINRSGRHVLDLVNDLLDISKIEAGQQEMNFESVGLNQALTEAVSIMQPQANRERVIIRSSFASELPDVVADVRSIKQIALNLLTNAVRYTGAGGQVIISTSYELTGGVTIRVRDTGIGMSAQEIEQAMKPFKQINTLKRERGDGTGLGLPLTKAMVEANRASFIISSTPGQGTLIEITFPSTRVLAQ